MIFTGLAITFFLIFLSYLKPKSRCLFRLDVIWIWMLQACNTGGMDYRTNEAIYLSGGEKTEWISIFIIDLFLKNNINYLVYRGFMASICIYILVYVILKISKRPNIVLLLYIIFLLADSKCPLYEHLLHLNYQ